MTSFRWGARSDFFVFFAFGGGKCIFFVSYGLYFIKKSGQSGQYIVKVLAAAENTTGTSTTFEGEKWS